MLLIIQTVQKTAHEAKATVKQKNSLPMKVVTKKSDIKEHYADVFEGVGCFLGPLYHIQVDPKIPPKLVRLFPMHQKEAFKQELDKQVTWNLYMIKIYVIVEGTDKFGRLKPRICLDPSNLNVAVICEPWFSKTLDDIAHLLADACIITTTDYIEIWRI